ncbi:6-phospho-beta-glucosidase [Mesorhizobium sp. CA18]|uniref:family 4 glycosyl hydrolase n=1 Tax=unclassified Mesorhizobium TaxID=325217 RepID=UPI001CCEB74D|nr:MULTISPECIES: 6-phospho-beta-glucosidase [unclassified Mesorhizobium]MBZ9737138.1 6-phospho-beta-glucosidase [Mesorhizobium sp. CA9]MBZ9826590.1 6-phospho-beta-glucosidase [Mesorhizobium sp. CA18]MBZ9830817.1 6-phospho-beta-glucosidase [Mesorhizobium sp. CA2]MBZ9835507.1 6-phospho-beta-glucosidase [Mesorhizobium sp. CA3]MBZ9875809.1 6-phospho-beta-glucosidase [Mesorhizobium sp. Ca11]
MTRVSVLGGSSPFTVALVDAIEANKALTPRLGEWVLVLQGRNVQNLNAVAHYARHRLGAFGTSVVSTTDFDAALTDADIVIVQTRFGGLEARVGDELFACELGCQADETLGPCGLLSAFRQMLPVDDLAIRMKAICPGAFVVNMINPLSLTTAMMLRHGLAVVGICELPLATLQAFARALRIEPAELHWNYQGLNHRGFIPMARTGDGDDLLQRVLQLAPNPATRKYRDDILRLGAVSTKYFAFFDGASVHEKGRAAALISLRDAIARELVADPTQCPAQIAKRDMPWYAQAVVPLVAARVGAQSYDATINVAVDGLLVEERRAHVLGDRIDIIESAPANGPFRDWLAAFEHHERLSLAALADPTPDTIGAAIEADRITPSDKVRTAAARIFRMWRDTARNASTAGGQQ